ncbi:MAG: ABC transporter ATP-binding protein [Solirubrobacterales bacterium]|nr:ABC transporter ATP-binding protein [Solirubrobacterales bacterium]MBV9715731.1 ABC transporter ATP-binding protein [Solirubrobacterales bacterium]
MTAIRLERLTKDFRSVLAVDNLDLSISDGEFVALLGPSGCGKTTTMNMIAGMETPTRGQIYFDERAMSGVAPGKRNVGFVFQNYAIFTHMTVQENLSFGLRARKHAPRREEIDREVKRIAEIVGVASILDRKAGRLSVNDMQKVALGRSMIVQPAIFLLDEPFSNLDAAFRAYMRAELKHIQHDIGQTMIYVTHDQVEAMSMADRIAVMDQGVLQQYATPMEVYERPANTFVARFVGSNPINFLPASELPAHLLRKGGGDEPLTAAIRPEYLTIVAPDCDRAALRAKVNLVEPLGAKDVIHLAHDGQELRVVSRPQRRPALGEHVGIALDPARLLLFDDHGQAVS